MTTNQEDGKYYFTGISTNISYEVRGNSSFTSHSSESEGNNWLETAIHTNDGIGGIGVGMDYSSGSFRLTNGTYNGSEFSFKYYSSGWSGGSRAGISTYEVAGFGERLAKGSLITGGILGGVEIINGMKKDGWSYGRNAQLATGSAAGGLAGAEIGADIGAWVVGGVVGVFTGGAGTAPGAIVGGIIGGWIGGWLGSDAGKGVVNKF